MGWRWFGRALKETGLKIKDDNQERIDTRTRLERKLKLMKNCGRSLWKGSNRLHNHVCLYNQTRSIFVKIN